MRRIACLWLPDWPVQRLRAGRPELQAKRILLHTRHAQRGLCVQACCEAARECGAAPGMPLSEAQALLRRAAQPTRAARGAAPHDAPAQVLDWHSEPHDPLADLEALRELAWLCERYSPLVGLEEGERPECLLLDATHLGPRGTPEVQWLGELLGEFAQRGFCLRAGLADTLGVAWAIARYSAGQRRASAIAPPGLPLRKLEHFPLAALRLEESALDLLAQLGVTTLGAFLKLPRAGLAARFGVSTLRRLDQASGKEPEVFQAYRPTPPWREQKLLEYPSSDRAGLEQVLRGQLAALTRSLQASQQGVMELSCRFEGPARPATAARVALFRPTVDAEHLFKLLELQLERLTFPEPIEKVVTEALRTARLEEHQAFFWRERGSLADSPRLRGMVERLASRLGAARVSRVRLRHDAQPEYAFVCEPLTSAGGKAAPMPARRKGARKKSAAGEEALLRDDLPLKTTWRILERPLLLLPSPIPLEVTALAPEGPPARVRWQGKWRRVVRHWGPERIDVGWHRGPSVRRDYFRVETDEGERLWVFQDRIRGAWRLHGFFS